MLWAGRLGVAAALAVLGLIAAGVTAGADAPRKPPPELLRLFEQIDEQLDRLIHDTRVLGKLPARGKAELKEMETAWRDGFKKHVPTFGSTGETFFELATAARQLQVATEAKDDPDRGKFWLDLASDSLFNARGRELPSGIRSALHALALRADRVAESGFDGEQVQERAAAMEQRLFSIVKGFPGPYYGISYLALLKHAAAMEEEVSEATIRHPEKALSHLVILKRHKQAIENALKGAAARPEPPPPIVSTPSSVQIETIPPYLERALDRELKAAGYLENYDASGNAVKAERSLEQATEALFAAAISAELVNFHAVDDEISAAVRDTLKAMGILEDDPPDPDAAKRHLQAAIKATKAGIAVLEKLLTAATPKPKVEELSCSFRMSLPPNYLPVDCHSTPVAKVVIRFPWSIHKNAWYQSPDEINKCAVAGATVTCAVSPVRTRFTITFGPKVGFSTAKTYLGAAFRITVTAQNGGTASWRCVIQTSPDDEVACRLSRPQR